MSLRSPVSTIAAAGFNSSAPWAFGEERRTVARTMSNQLIDAGPEALTPIPFAAFVIVRYQLRKYWLDEAGVWGEAIE